VRLVPMQINCYAGDGDVREHQRAGNNLPSTRVQQTLVQKPQYEIDQSMSSCLTAC
jgi:hypothetical protein